MSDPVSYTHLDVYKRQALDVITNVTDEELAYVVNSGEPLTIENLKKAADEIKNKDTKVSAATDKTAYTKSGLDLLTARRQLEETRLKMTSEANLSLLKKGISIDTMELSQLVEELKTQENEYYSRLLSGDGIAPKEADVALSLIHIFGLYVLRPVFPQK